MFELLKIYKIPLIKNKESVFGEIVHAHIADYYRYFPIEQIDQETIKKSVEEMYKGSYLMFGEEERKEYNRVLGNFNFYAYKLYLEVTSDTVSITQEDGSFEIIITNDTSTSNNGNFLTTPIYLPFLAIIITIFSLFSQMNKRKRRN